MNWIKSSLVIVLIGITYLSLKEPSSPVSIEVNDKVGHLIAYFVLCVNFGLLLSKQKLYWSFIIAFAYSCLMEFLQGYVPGRFVDAYDLIANGAGAAIGLLVLYLLKDQILQLLRTLKLVNY